jgi:PhnB protein
MPADVKPIPDGYHAVTPYLFIKGAARAIEFYKQAFGATERMRLEMPGGTIGHAELTIGDSAIMLADESPSMQALSPPSVGGTPVMIHLYVEDVDAVFNRAVAAGARVLQTVENKFYGDRSASIIDPSGHQWGIATRKENLTPEEIGKRAAAMFGKGK